MKMEMKMKIPGPHPSTSSQLAVQKLSYLLKLCSKLLTK